MWWYLSTISAIGWWILYMHYHLISFAYPSGCLLYSILFSIVTLQSMMQIICQCWLSCDDHKKITIFRLRLQFLVSLLYVGFLMLWFIISKFLRMYSSIICCHLPMVSDVQNLFLWLGISCKGQKQIINRPCDTVSWSLQALLLLYPCLHLSFAWLPVFTC